MESLNKALQQLRDDHKQAQSQVRKLEEAIAAIEGLVGRKASTHSRNGSRPDREISAAGRRRMVEAQKARWAKWRQAKASASGNKAPAKRTLSAVVRRKIAAAQRARWAKLKAKAKQ